MVTPDDAYANATIRVVQDMTERLTTFERHGDTERAKLRTDMLDLVASMRTDVHRAIASVAVQVAQHEQSHASDLVARSHRQLKQDAWMALLTIIQLANLLLAAYIIGRTGGSLLGMY